MNDARLQLLMFAVSACLFEASCTLFDFRPREFAIERYIRSRVRPAGRSLNPVTEFDQVLDFVALVNQFGYPAEEHLLTTVDGYKLRIHRIPGSPSSPKAKNKPIVYFQHGLFASSDTWVLMGPDRDFAYILADAGYDVWFGNARGNTYSRSHIRLSPDNDAEFWNFSWHEIAMYDVSMIIDYILAETGRERLIYIGHSMGTTISYVLLSTRPEYNERVELVISWAPVAFWHDRPSPFIRLLINNIRPIKNFVLNARLHEVFPLAKANSQIARTSCTDQSPLQPLCINLLYFMSGYNPKEMNKTLIPYLLSYFPAGGSAKTLIHFSQNMESGEFRMYDGGYIHNFMLYGSEKPPRYNLSNIVAPVALFYGKGDTIVAKGDPLELAQKLPNVVTLEAVPDERFAHLDFLFGSHLKTLLLDRVMNLINRTFRSENSV